MTTRIVCIVFMWANILYLLVHPQFLGLVALCMVPWACIYLGECIEVKTRKVK